MRPSVKWVKRYHQSKLTPLKYQLKQPKEITNMYVHEAIDAHRDA